MAQALVEFRGITKKFAGVTALDGVSLAVSRGECHALMGENGAGKSTLGKILAGIYRPDAGQVLIRGQARHFRSPGDARAAGVAMVHQELALVPELSVAENLSLGQTPRRLGAFVDGKLLRRRALHLLQRIGLGEESINPDQPMRSLSTAQEQMVQIAAAIGCGAEILIFDEPTSSLSAREVQHLFALIDQLKARGVTILYVSHRLPELFRLCDRISVLRDGRYVDSLPTKEATEDALVRMMVGRAVESYAPASGLPADAPVLLQVQGLASPGHFRDVSFSLRRGEILGLAGLVGAGRSEIARALFGLDSAATGQVTVAGRPLPLGSTAAAKRTGLGMVPEDRKRQGLALGMSCRANFSMAMLESLSRWGWLRRGAERRLAEDFFARLQVRTPSLETPVAALSGGNQQKVVIAKWLSAQGEQGQVLIVDEPTRGVDVGAKAAIHKLLAELAEGGMAILLISSELPELLTLSHRILIMRDGRLVGEMPRTDASEETLMRCMAGARAGAGSGAEDTGPAH